MTIKGAIIITMTIEGAIIISKGKGYQPYQIIMRRECHERIGGKQLARCASGSLNISRGESGRGCRDVG